LASQKIEVFEVFPWGSGFKLFTGAEELSPEVKQILAASMANMRPAGYLLLMFSISGCGFSLEVA
jgi:hypothetical protein